ncbi:hypothetical protein [Yersinia aldovae]|uniref:hypothetical protein n=1 Tax=Yersinia aldovae TaxID=29483 RepID=UPI00066FF0DC|nr:hypothetical protein [Yersinia aldovae]
MVTFLQHGKITGTKNPAAGPGFAGRHKEALANSIIDFSSSCLKCIILFLSKVFLISLIAFASEFDGLLCPSMVKSTLDKFSKFSAAALLM